MHHSMPLFQQVWSSLGKEHLTILGTKLGYFRLTHYWDHIDVGFWIQMSKCINKFGHNI